MNVLCVAAHPDDEVLGCGGALAAHAARGDHAEVLLLAEGVTSRHAAREQADTGELDALGRAAEEANRRLGVARLIRHGFPDNRMDSVPLLDVVKVVEAEIARLRPQLVYTHFGGDVNIDHRITYQACVTACRPQPGMPVRSLLCFETASSTEWQPPGGGEAAFAPNWFVAIDAFLDLKLAALAAYAPELRPWPHPRSPEAVRHLARWRGASIGVAAAEAFVLARHLVP